MSANLRTAVKVTCVARYCIFSSDIKRAQRCQRREIVSGALLVPYHALFRLQSRAVHFAIVI